MALVAFRYGNKVDLPFFYSVGFETTPPRCATMEPKQSPDSGFASLAPIYSIGVLEPIRERGT